MNSSKLVRPYRHTKNSAQGSFLAPCRVRLLSREIQRYWQHRPCQTSPSPLKWSRGPYHSGQIPQQPSTHRFQKRGVNRKGPHSEQLCFQSRAACSLLDPCRTCRSSISSVRASTHNTTLLTRDKPGQSCKIHLTCCL